MPHLLAHPDRAVDVSGAGQADDVALALGPSHALSITAVPMECRPRASASATKARPGNGAGDELGVVARRTQYRRFLRAFFVLGYSFYE